MSRPTLTTLLAEALAQILDDLSASTYQWGPATGVCQAAWEQAIAALRQAGYACTEDGEDV